MLNRRRYAYSIVALIWLVTIVTKFKYNGLIFGLDYGLFHPDGTLYSFRTLTWLGKNENQAGVEVANWYAKHAFKMTEVDPKALFFDTNPNWQFYKIRLLYPFLSIPFVYIFGMNGMLVIPALSYLGVLLVFLEIGFTKQRIPLSIWIVIAFSTSPTVTRWMFIDTTDSLFVLLGSIATLMLLRHSNSRKWLSAQIILVILMSLTRVSIFFWIPISVILFFKSKKQSLVVALVSCISFSPIMLMRPEKAFMPGIQDQSFWLKIQQFLPNAFRVLVYEFGELLVLDRLLLILLGAAFLFSIRNITNYSSRFFLSLSFSLFVMGAVNGTVGVNFRYQLPLITLICWVIIENFPRISEKVTDTRVD